jgi:hypothetical protein
MLKSIDLAAVLALATTLLASPRHLPRRRRHQRQYLRPREGISTSKHVCDVKLLKDRFSGRFAGSAIRCWSSIMKAAATRAMFEVAASLRQNNPTGKSFPFYRNRVKPRNQKYSASR